jgi:hypothetical protein
MPTCHNKETSGMGTEINTKLACVSFLTHWHV